MKQLKLNKSTFEFNQHRTIYVDFTTTGRWKTKTQGTWTDLYIEIVEQKDISKWYQRCNIQPVTRWVAECAFTEVEPIVETINECN